MNPLTLQTREAPAVSPWAMCETCGTHYEFDSHRITGQSLQRCRCTAPRYVPLVRPTEAALAVGEPRRAQTLAAVCAICGATFRCGALYDRNYCGESCRKAAKTQAYQRQKAARREREAGQ